MASKYVCQCGEVVYTNLFSGNGMRLLVDEDLLDVPDAEVDGKLVHRIIVDCVEVAECPKCKRLALIDREYNIRLYQPEPE